MNPSSLESRDDRDEPPPYDPPPYDPELDEPPYDPEPDEPDEPDEPLPPRLPPNDPPVCCATSTAADAGTRGCAEGAGAQRQSAQQRATRSAQTRVVTLRIGSVVYARGALAAKGRRGRD